MFENDDQFNDQYANIKFSSIVIDLISKGDLDGAKKFELTRMRGSFITLMESGYNPTQEELEKLSLLFSYLKDGEVFQRSEEILKVNDEIESWIKKNKEKFTISRSK